MQIVIGDRHAGMSAQIAGQRGAAVGVMVHVGQEGVAEAVNAGIKAKLPLLAGEGLPQGVAGHAIALLRDEQRGVRRAFAAKQQVPLNMGIDEAGDVDLRYFPTLALARDDAILDMFGRLKYIPVEEVEIKQLEKKLKEEGYAVSISVEPVPIFKRKKNWVQIEYDHIEFFHDLDCEFDSEDDDTIPNPFDPLLNLGKRILKFLSRRSAKG